jgi:hypothetical protein
LRSGRVAAGRAHGAAACVLLVCTYPPPAAAAAWAVPGSRCAAAAASKAPPVLGPRCCVPSGPGCKRHRQRHRPRTSQQQQRRLAVLQRQRRQPSLTVLSSGPPLPSAAVEPCHHPGGCQGPRSSGRATTSLPHSARGHHRRTARAAADAVWRRPFPGRLGRCQLGGCSQHGGGHDDCRVHGQWRRLWRRRLRHCWRCGGPGAE